MKYNSSVFFLAQTSYTFDKNSLSEWNLWTFEWLGENSPNSSFHIYLKPQVSFSLNFASLFMNWEISLLYFFLQKEPTTVQNFRLLTAQVILHQICTLIGYFCRKYIKFQLKIYFLFQKWQEFGEFSSEHWKVWHICNLIGPLVQSIQRLT